MKIKIILVLSILVITSHAQNKKEIRYILNQVSADAIKGHMTFLADDLMEGRLPGTRGFSLTAKYIETSLISLGIQPGVRGASYIQQVPLKKGSVDENESGIILHNGSKEEKLVYGKDFILNPYFSNERSVIGAPLVFAGFGVSAPELNYDDYKDIDVRGKIVVYINSAPQTFPTSERAYYSSTDEKYAAAIRRGAVGIISFTLPSSKRTTWDATLKRARQGSYKWRDGEAVVKSYPELNAVASFNNEKAEKLFINAATPLQKILGLAAEGKSISMPLNISASISVKTQFKSVESCNIVGMIKGSDAALQNEYVVYSAHMDHFGIASPVKNDSIYNGAHDDASGMSILLEIAKAYRSLSVPPKRSVIFAFVTGEEMGLLGSDYFINNPPVNGKIVANLAIDMPFFFHPVLDIVPYGADHSTLGKQTEKAAKMLDLKISPDPIPEQVVFIRSDHYSFIKKGIPALFIKSGFMTVPSDTTDRSRTDVSWRSSIYHTPQDDMNQPFDFNAATTHVKINFLIGLFTANEIQPPAWNKNDFFGLKFKGPMSK